MKVWQCTVCKYIHRGDAPPEKCPICGVDASKFIEIDEASIPEKKAPKRKITETAGPVSTRTPPKTPEPPPKEEPAAPETGFEKIKSLLVRHHAHPVSVHTPNGILPAAVVLWVLAWLFNWEIGGKAALINMIFVILVLPLVIFTGVLEWKKKYNAAMTLIFKIKILAATLTTASCTIILAWYLIDPEILSSSRAWAFILMNVIMLAAAGVAGHIGGKLVFKD